jgi:MoxR-like ATPase
MTEATARSAGTPVSVRDQITQLRNYIDQRIIDQEALTLRLLIALLADGHLLVEGAPGLAKTTAIKTLAQGLEGEFHRIQFTPDLLPADLTGTEIYRPQDGSFHFQRGPIFHNMVLADEINRAPAKVQSALLEAMAEHQVSIGRETYPLPQLFLVMATQNPIEQEGTYPLPEAQLDRFLMHVRVAYPGAAGEKKILHLVREQARNQHNGHVATAPRKVSQDTLFSARREILDLHMSPALEDYLIEIVTCTRDPSRYDAKLARWVQFGASPRASLALDRCARAHAWLQARDYVSPEDIHAIAPDVLRHRVLLSYQAEAEGVTPDQFISEILRHIAIP